MYTYTERIYSYNSKTQDFKRHGETKWHIFYTAKAIIVDGRWLPVYHCLDFSYKLRKDGIYTCYPTPKEFCRQFFATDLQMDVWCKNIVHHVYQYGKIIDSMCLAYPIYVCRNDTPNSYLPQIFYCCNPLQMNGLARAWREEFHDFGFQTSDICKDYQTFVKGNIKKQITFKAI